MEAQPPSIRQKPQFSYFRRNGAAFPDERATSLDVPSATISPPSSPAPTRQSLARRLGWSMVVPEKIFARGSGAVLAHTAMSV